MSTRDITDNILATWRRELPGVVGDEMAIAKRAARLSAIFSERVSAELARMHLTKAEYEILAVLRAAGSPFQLRPSDLADRLLLSSGGTSNLLRRLTEAGLVEREADQRDARSSWVRLTKQGIKVAEQAVRAASDAQAALLRTVPSQTADAAIKALRDLLIALGDTNDQAAST